MNLIKKKVEISDKYAMYFDMESVTMYKDANKSFIEGYGKLLKLEDETVLDFIACTLRDKENENKPIGFEVVKENPMMFLINYGIIAVNLVIDSFSDKDKDKDVKKNK